MSVTTIPMAFPVLQPGRFTISCTMPVMYGLLGFVVGVIVSALYNGLSGLVGGVQLELE